MTDLEHRSGGVSVVARTGERQQHDAVVVATGAVLGALVGQFGVRQPVQAGRGYSFSVPADPMPRGPLYFPKQRVACTPLGGRLRVTRMMEFRRPGDPLDPRRVQAIVDAVRPFLTGVDLNDRRKTTAAMSGSGRVHAPPTARRYWAPPPPRGCSSPVATACGVSLWAR